MSSEYGTPEASHSFGYMLIEVKPGSVLISLTYSGPLSPASRKSTRAMPALSTAVNTCTASRRTSSACWGDRGAGISSFELESRYFAS